MFLYALPQFAIAYLILGLVNFVPAFYATEMGISMLTISGLMLLSRGLDVVTDPIIGTLSDRTNSRFGRRKPWIAIGLPVLLLGAWLLFVPGDSGSSLYFFISISILFLGLTLIQLPYVSWGAELSADYDVRTRITSLRERIGAIGSIAALLTAYLISLKQPDTIRPILNTMAWVVTVSLPVLVLLALVRVPADVVSKPAMGGIGFFAGARIALQNRPFRFFGLGVFLLYVGLMPGGAVGWFVFESVFGRPELFSPSVLLEFAASFVGLPFWTAVAVRTSKHRAATFALIWIAVFSALVPLAAMWGVYGAMTMVTIRSLALGACLMLPYSIIADVIDVDEVETGTKRTGVFVAFGGIVVKFALTVGVAAALALPGLFGFDPSSDTNSDLAIASVLGTFSWMSAAFFLLAAIVFWRYPLSRQMVADTQKALQERRAKTG